MSKIMLASRRLVVFIMIVLLVVSTFLAWLLIFGGNSSSERDTITATVEAYTPNIRSDQNGSQYNINISVSGYGSKFPIRYVQVHAFSENCTEIAVSERLGPFRHAAEIDENITFTVDTIPHYIVVTVPPNLRNGSRSQVHIEGRRLIEKNDTENVYDSYGLVDFEQPCRTQ